MDLKKLIDLSQLAKSQIDPKSRRRQQFTEISAHRDKTFLGLLGPRGAGKTMLLKQVLTVSENAFYISLDTLSPDTDLFELIKELNSSYNFTTFLLDEVHYNNSINQALKSAFDFLKIKIIFTSSIALKMFESAHDLARRVKFLTVPYFSLREYLAFSDVADFAPLNTSKVFSSQTSPEFALADSHLHKYLDGALLPFALEVKDWKTSLSNILQRVVFEDTPRVQPITLQESQTILKAVQFIGKSAIDGINPSSLSKNLAITRYKAEQYLGLLEQAFVVQQVFPRGTNVLREPKVLLSPPYRLLFQEFEQALGGLREDFAVAAIKQAGLKISYIKSNRGKKLPDYVVDLEGKEVVLEVGGQSKTTVQLADYEKDLARFVFKDGPPYGERRRPLSALGLLS